MGDESVRCGESASYKTTKAVATTKYLVHLPFFVMIKLFKVLGETYRDIAHTF